jgi:DNA repair protein RadC
LRLSDLELVAVLLGRGSRSKPLFALASEVLSLVDATEAGELNTRTLAGAVRGLGEARAATIVAALEFARRLLCPAHKRICFPVDALPLLQHYADRKQECFLCISLNGAHEVIAVRVVSIGLVNRTVVHPREVYADPLTDRAAAVLIAHNHPSGNVRPSAEDREVTRRIHDAGKVLGIPMLDHLIFSTKGYYSFLENGEI